jgi:hypothetical protein
MILGVGAVGVLVGALVFGLRPQAQEAEEPVAEDVTQSELEMYIAVYTAMQADHDLTLDAELAQKGVSLTQFRHIERRVQKQERLVRKVRDALLAQAKARADTLAPSSARAPAAPEKPPAADR